MPSARKLFVFDSIQRPNLKPPETAFDALPQIRSLPGKDDDMGLIELVDGSLRRIICLNGFDIPPDLKGFAVVDETFGAILDCLNDKTSLQLLAINRPVDVGEYCKNFLDLNAEGNAYLEWYADYTRKWFGRVCEVRLVPRKTFYLILGAEPSRKASREKQIARLDQFVKRVLKILSGAGQFANVLTRSETRLLIHSSMRLSYPSGLKEEPVEMMRASTMPDIKVENGKQFLLVDNSRVAVQVVSSLPATHRYGWLLDLLTMECATALSIHCRLGDKNSVRQASAKMPVEARRKVARKIAPAEVGLIEMSFYYSIAPHVVGDDKQLKVWQNAAREKLSSHAALITPKCDQFSAWTSTLPLGIDSGGIAHTILDSDARKNWPLYTGSCGLTGGLPMGFAAISSEPVFYDHSKKSGILAVASDFPDLSFFNALISVRLLTANFHVLYLDDGRNSLSFLQEVLGHEIVNDFRCRLPAVTALKQNAVLTTLSVEIEPTDLRDLLIECAETYGSASKPLALLLPSVGDWCSVACGARQFKEVLQELERLNVLLCASEVTDRLRSDGKLVGLLDSFCETKVVLPQKKNHLSFLRGLLQHDNRSWAFNWLKVDSVNDCEGQFLCFMQSGVGSGLVRIVPSPMDYWLCLSHKEMGIEKIRLMKDSLREKNPKLSAVDLARQTVYYLGIQQSDFSKT